MFVVTSARVTKFKMAPGWQAKLEDIIHDKVTEPITNAVFRDVVRYTPVDTGDLVSHVGKETTPLVGRIFVRGSNAQKMIWVEYGTAPHIIRAKNKKVLADREKGEIYGKTVHHPGTRAQAPMRRALYKARSL